MISGLLESEVLFTVLKCLSRSAMQNVACSTRRLTCFAQSPSAAADIVNGLAGRGLRLGVGIAGKAACDLLSMALRNDDGEDLRGPNAWGRVGSPCPFAQAFALTRWHRSLVFCCLKVPVAMLCADTDNKMAKT